MMQSLFLKRSVLNRFSIVASRSYCINIDGSEAFSLAHHRRLQQLMRTKRYQQAQNYYESLLRKGLQPTLTTQYIVADLLVRQDKDGEAFNQLEQQKEESSYVDARVYNPLISAFATNGKISKAEELVDTMKRENVSLNGGTYSALVRGYSQEGSMEKAMEIIETMRAAGVIPNQHTYTNLISGYAKIGKTEIARAVIDQVKADGSLPTNQMYQFLIAGYFRQGDVDEALSVVEEIKSSGAELDVRTYNSIVNGYTMNGMFDEARGIVNDMKENGIVPNVFTFNSMIRGYCNKEMFSNAIKVIERMRQTYSIIISGLIKAEKPQEALDTIEQLREDGFYPLSYMYTDIAALFEKQGDEERAREIINFSQQEREAFITSKQKRREALKEDQADNNPQVADFDF